MNIKGLIIAGACGVAWGVGFVILRKMNKSYTTDVNNAVDHEVYEQFGEELKDARNTLTLAKAQANVIEKAEIESTKDILSTNTEYQTAKAAAEAGKRQLETLKKNLKAAQAGNTTQVAAANGNQSVAVSIKDTSQIAAIQSDISKLENEIKSNEITRDTIWRVTRKSVTDQRTPEDIALFNNVKEAEKTVSKVKFESELYKNNLKQNDDFMFEIQKKAYVKHYKPALQVVGTLLVTVPAVAALTWMWWSTLRNIKTYYDIQRGAM